MEANRHHPESAPPDRGSGRDRNTGASGRPPGPVSCRRIQAVLFDYLTHELGPSRALLIREHLRHCPDCRNAAGRLQGTLQWLHEADPAGLAPPRLSNRRRRRLNRALLHPVLDRLARHHVRVSLAVALVLLTIILLMLLARRRTPPPERVFPISPYPPEWMRPPEPLEPI